MHRLLMVTTLITTPQWCATAEQIQRRASVQTGKRTRSLWVV